MNTSDRRSLLRQGGVRAETRMVPPGHGHLQFYRDLDGVDIDRDESVSAAFFDEYGLPPVHPMRRGYRPSLSSAIGRAIRTAADPSPRNPDDPSSSSPRAVSRATSTKEHS